MKPVEKSKQYDEFTVGTSPRVSIDSRFAMHDSHNPEKDQLRFLPHADHPHNAELAFAAALRIFETLRPAFPYLEVIKVSFNWNYNQVHGPLIVASVVIVDPLTSNKAKVEVFERMARLYKDEGESDEKILTSLVQNLVTATRKQIEAFRAERAELTAAVEHFDSLPQAL